jgi:DNA-binding NtrC family response regulator
MPTLLTASIEPRKTARKIKIAMRRAGGSVPDAARDLGIGTTTLYTYLRVLEIDVPRKQRGRPAKRKSTDG